MGNLEFACSLRVNFRCSDFPPGQKTNQVQSGLLYKPKWPVGSYPPQCSNGVIIVPVSHPDKYGGLSENDQFAVANLINGSFPI